MFWRAKQATPTETKDPVIDLLSQDKKEKAIQVNKKKIFFGCFFSFFLVFFQRITFSYTTFPIFDYVYRWERLDQGNFYSAENWGEITSLILTFYLVKTFGIRKMFIIAHIWNIYFSVLITITSPPVFYEFWTNRFFNSMSYG